MAHKRASVLAQIEADVLDDTVPLSSLLQKCIVLGGKAGSEKMRDWARQELNGYRDRDSIPDYRHLGAQVRLVITNRAGYNPMTRPLSESDLSDQLRKILAELKIDLTDVPLGSSIGELEALASSNEAEQKLVPYWADVMLHTLNEYYIDAATSRAASIYWSVSRTSLQGVVVRVRAALAELVAELITLTPEGQDVPDKDTADAVTVYLFTGDRNVIHNLHQHASGSGTNVTVGGPASGPMSVSGAGGPAVVGQTANGANSSVVGSQTVQGDHSTVSGRDTGAAPAAHEGWWTRLRKRGLVVAIATIIGALAAVASVVVAVLALMGWKP